VGSAAADAADAAAVALAGSAAAGAAGAAAEDLEVDLCAAMRETSGENRVQQKRYWLKMVRLSSVILFGP
jgi:hypothetical protein